MTEPTTGSLRVLELVSYATDLGHAINTSAADVIDALGLSGLTLVREGEQRPGILEGTDPNRALLALLDTLHSIGVDADDVELEDALAGSCVVLGEPSTQDEADARTAAWLTAAEAA